MGGARERERESRRFKIEAVATMWREPLVARAREMGGGDVCSEDRVRLANLAEPRLRRRRTTEGSRGGGAGFPGGREDAGKGVAAVDSRVALVAGRGKLVRGGDVTEGVG